MPVPSKVLGRSRPGALPKHGIPSKHGALGHLSEDEELQQAVCAALIEDSELDSSHIGVRVVTGQVILSGRVRSVDHCKRAIEVAQAQSGVHRVQAEQLRVDAA